MRKDGSRPNEGRPTKYSKEMLAKTLEYIDSCQDTVTTIDGRQTVTVNIPTAEGLARHLKVNKSTVYEWASQHPKFSDALSDLSSEQSKRLINNGLSGSYNSTIAKLLLHNHGYSDKQQTDHTTNGENINTPILVKFVGGDEPKNN